MRLLTLLLAVAAALVLPTLATASPPANDDFGAATVVSSMPFTDRVDITDATRTFDEPLSGCYGPPQHTAWYAVTAVQAELIRIGGSSSIDDVSVSVYRDQGLGLGSLQFVGCGSGSAPTVDIAATNGQTYYVQLGNAFSSGGVVDVSIAVVPPPVNDDVAGATAVSLPLSEVVDTSAASIEFGEPTPSCFYAAGASVWYKISPAHDMSVTVTVGAPDLTTTTVYVGTPFDGLLEVGCRTYSGPLTFRAQSGATTYVRVASFGARLVDVRIEKAPDPIADFSWFPDEPSIFDAVQFSTTSMDPGGAPWRSFTWQFGDGIRASDCCVAHRFTRDGQYSVELAVETLDGRTARVTKVLTVKTHDVVVRNLNVPRSAKTGQRRLIEVDIVSARYPETVEVQLFRTRAGAFGNPYELIGTLVQPVRVRPRASAPFVFSYTISSEDAVAGKLSFMAVARVVDHIDALPGDNQLTSSVVRVNR